MKKTMLIIFGLSLLCISSSVFASCDFSNSTFEQERNESYFRACNKWIISDWNISDARLDKELTRIEMARMLNIFSMEIMWNEEDPSKNCNWYSDLINYSDISTASRACHLWIMWIWIDKFRPNDSVSRAEFWTVLSRILYWEQFNVTEWEYYKLHLQALKNNWIISNDNPNIKEMKWYVLLMLKRYIDRIEKENKRIEDLITLKNDNWFILKDWQVITFSNNENSIIFKISTWGKRTDSLQWSCAPWFHVASRDEMIDLLNIWRDIRKDNLVDSKKFSNYIEQSSNERNQVFENGIANIFLKDIGEPPSWSRYQINFRTRSFDRNENIPYSFHIGINHNSELGYSSILSVDSKRCWLWCENRVFCLKTK